MLISLTGHSGGNTFGRGDTKAINIGGECFLKPLPGQAREWQVNAHTFLPDDFDVESSFVLLLAGAFAEIMLRDVGHEVVCVGRS